MIVWQPVASEQLLIERAHLLALIREFFAMRGVQEVQTPNLSTHSVSDPNIHSVNAGERFLQTSPEFHMKRMLATYSSDVFQVTQAFRRDELGRNHQPEFALLEWYRISMSWRHLAMEVCELIEFLAIGALSLETAEFVSYREIFAEQVGVDPIQAPVEKLSEIARSLGLSMTAAAERDMLLEFLFDRCVVPAFKKDRLTVVTYFPASQASLAQLDADDSAVAQRFECYLKGYELANGFAELADADVQRSRFENDNACRSNNRLEKMDIDERLLSALQHGLPECSGVALGFDRLLQAISDKEAIEQVMAFPWLHA